MRGPAQLAAYESDGLTAFHVKPLAIVVPETQDEVIKLVRFCVVQRDTRRVAAQLRKSGRGAA